MMSVIRKITISTDKPSAFSHWTMNVPCLPYSSG